MMSRCSALQCGSVKPVRLADPTLSEGDLAALARAAKFVGSSKHKREPLRFGQQQFTGHRGDATTCDGDAGFLPEHAKYVRNWMARGIRAGLVAGDLRTIWAVADTGWIFTGRATSEEPERVYHGYPLLPGSPGAQLIYDRFKRWVEQHPKARHQNDLKTCADRYGLRP